MPESKDAKDDKQQQGGRRGSPNAKKGVSLRGNVSTMSKFNADGKRSVRERVVNKDAQAKVSPNFLYMHFFNYIYFR